MDNQNFLTKEGLEKLRKEYEELKNNKLPKAIERVSLARMQGDLTENSEYAMAKEELSFIEDRITELENILKNAKTVSPNANKNQVNIGSKVTIVKDGKKEVFFIVSDFESNPAERKISLKSPIGKALFGKKKGDEVIVETPDGPFKYKILIIE